MVTATDNKTELLINQVKKEKDINEAISLLADIIQTSYLYNINEFNKLDDKINKINETLNGNGHPELSVIGRMSRLDEKIKNIYTGLGVGGGAILTYAVIELIKLI
jgi:hypothetical protein